MSTLVRRMEPYLVQGSRVWGLGFRDQGLGLRVPDLGFRLRVWGLGQPPEGATALNFKP